MKKIIFIGVMLATSLIFAQKTNTTYEKVEDKIKATFYHDNGKIQQHGFYKDKKLHGKWVSYNIKGEKVSQGTYDLGKKVGTWYFWDGKTLSEVNYNNNTIAGIKTWNKNSNVVVNFKK